jgi:hypothetical protein
MSESITSASLACIATDIVCVTTPSCVWLDSYRPVEVLTDAAPLVRRQCECRTHPSGVRKAGISWFKPEGAMRRQACLIIPAGFLLFGSGMVAAPHGALPREYSLTAKSELDDGP